MPSSQDPTPDDSEPTAAVPPIIEPEDFERFEGFRETTLAVILDKPLNGALRLVGQMLYTIVLEYWRYWPEEPEGSFRHQTRAVIADMRHVQGYLFQMARENDASHLSPHDAHLSKQCPGLAERVKEIADALEKELGAWRGEE
jgi:hypothetical protein